jgi:hypothetical protein
MADLPFDFDPNAVPLTNWDDPSPAQIVNLSRRIQMLEFQVQQLQEAQPPQGS